MTSLLSFKFLLRNITMKIYLILFYGKRRDHLIEQIMFIGKSLD